MKNVILIVDDQDVVTRVCELIIERLGGFKTIVAHNGLEGISLYDEYRDRICLILTDVNMPVMNGYEMVEYFLDRYDDLRIIMMTGAHPIISDAVRNACRLIAKPFSPAQLSTMIKACLK